MAAARSDDTWRDSVGHGAGAAAGFFASLLVAGVS
jgi:hypothetical protein